jgi:hypothetical protein
MSLVFVLSISYGHAIDVEFLFVGYISKHKGENGH